MFLFFSIRGLYEVFVLVEVHCFTGSFQWFSIFPISDFSGSIKFFLGLTSAMFCRCSFSDNQELFARTFIFVDFIFSVQVEVEISKILGQLGMRFVFRPNEGRPRRIVDVIDSLDVGGAIFGELAH